MKLVFDNKHQTCTLVCDRTPSDNDKAVVEKFVTGIQETPEPIGGIFFEDITGATIKISMSDSTFLILLTTVRALVQGVDLRIAYHTSIISDDMFAKAFRIPMWFLALCRFMGVIKKNLTFADFLDFQKRHPSSNIDSQL